MYVHKEMQDEYGQNDGLFQTAKQELLTSKRTLHFHCSKVSREKYVVHFVLMIYYPCHDTTKCLFAVDLA